MAAIEKMEKIYSTSQKCMLGSNHCWGSGKGVFLVIYESCKELYIAAIAVYGIWMGYRYCTNSILYKKWQNFKRKARLADLGYKPNLPHHHLNSVP
jgi:hypothetical protein